MDGEDMEGVEVGVDTEDTEDMEDMEDMAGIKDKLLIALHVFTA